MTYQPPPGNGSPPLPQTYPRVPTAPPGPSPQLSPMPAPRQAQPVPSPQPTTPPPDHYPHPARHSSAPPAVSGPPLLRSLQGQLRNPVPVVAAVAGLVLVSMAFFLPLASYTFKGQGDPLRDMYFLPNHEPNLYLTLDQHPVVVPLVITVAVTLALSASRRWLLFGRLASYGLGFIGIATAIGTTFTWQRRMREVITGMTEYRDGMTEAESESASNLIDDTEIGFGAGVWLLVAGIIVLAVAVALVKTGAPGHYAAPQPIGYPQPGGYPPPMAPQSYAAAAPPPQAEPAESGDRGLAVHDDPPSLSIYKPPKKDA